MARSEKNTDKLHSKSLSLLNNETVETAVGNELIKASAVIQIANRLSLLQRKVGNALLKHAFYNLEYYETHSINISMLAERVGFDSKNLEVLKEALVSLAKTSVEFNILGKDRKSIWGVSAILSQAIIRDGVLFYSYPPFMRGALRHPEIYAKLNLTVQNGFRSKHALALWEFFTDYLGSKRNQCETEFILLSQYRSLLGVGENDYQDFRDVSRRLIREPIQELNNVSDLQVEWPPVFLRRMRRVEGVKFTVSRKQQLLLDYDALEENIPQNMEKMLIERMMNLGYTARIAAVVLKRHPVDYIDGNLLVVEKRISQGAIESPAALLTAALRDDYRVVKSPVQIQAEQRHVQLETEELRQKARDFLEEIYNEFIKERISKALKQLPEKEEAQLRSDFEEEIEDNSFLQERYRRMGLRSVLIRGMYHSFAKKRLLHNPEEHSLEGFLTYLEQNPRGDQKIQRALLLVREPF